MSKSSVGRLVKQHRSGITSRLSRTHKRPNHMTTVQKPPTVKFGCTLLAYLLSVTIATLVISLPTIFHSIRNLLASTGQAHTMSMRPLLSGFGIAWVIAFFAALVPFIAGLAVARFRVRSYWYFIIGALITSLALKYWYNTLPPFFPELPERSFLEKYLHEFPLFSSAGIMAGLCCYWVLRRCCKNPHNI